MAASIDLLAHDLLIIEWAIQQHEKGSNLIKIKSDYTDFILKKESETN